MYVIMTKHYVRVAINSRLLLCCYADVMCSKMFRGLLKNILKVFSGDSGKQGTSENAHSSKNRVKGYGYGEDYGSDTAGLYLSTGDPELVLISAVTSSCGRLLSYLVDQFTSKQADIIGKVDSSEETVNTSQSNGPVLTDEGYQSILDCSTSQLAENKLVEIEECYKRQIEALELELKLQQKLNEKKYYIKDELINDEEYFELKGKGGKGYVKKICNVEEERAHLIDNYLSNIKTEKKYLQFLQLDEETQLMICKIDVFRGFGYGNGFFDKLLEMFEWKSTQLEKMKKTVAELKQLEDDYRKIINELIDENQKIIDEKDQEIDDLKKKLQARKKMGGYLRESCRMKGGRKDVKIKEMDEESQLMIANINALRESDNKVYRKVLSMSEKRNTKV